MRVLAAVAGALALVSSAGASATSPEQAVRYLEGRRTFDGGFAEPGRAPTAGLTA